MSVLTQSLHKAFELHQKGQMDEAIKAYEALDLESSEEKAKCYELLGIAYAQKQDFKKALSHFQRALRLRPDRLSIQNNLATCHKKLGHTQKAMKLYKHILKHHPFQCVTLNNLASLYLQENQHQVARYLLKKAISLQPKYADAYYNLGLIEGIEPFKQALDLGHMASGYHCALYYESEGKLEASKQHYELCLSHIQNHALAHHGLARVLLALEDDEKALAHFIQAQRIDPYIPHLMENIASYYHVKGMHANAVEYWTKALHQTDNRVEILYNIGVAYQYMNRHEDALQYFQEVLESDPKHSKTHINIAAIALQNNQTQNAINHYKTVLELDPENEEVQYILSALCQEDAGFEKAPSGYVTHLFDQYAGHYNEHLVKMLKYQLPKKVELLLYEHYKPRSNLRILDLGCGTGLMGSVLQPFAKVLDGVDLSPNMLLEASKTARYHHLEEMDCLDYLSQCEPYDMIIALELCPYLGDLTPLLKSVQNALSPKGVFIMSIEKTGQSGFVLSEYARYQHNVLWVKSIIKTLGMKIVEDEPTTLRTQNSKPVSGHLFMIQR